MKVNFQCPSLQLGLVRGAGPKAASVGRVVLAWPPTPPPPPAQWPPLQPQSTSDPLCSKAIAQNQGIVALRDRFWISRNWETKGNKRNYFVALKPIFPKKRQLRWFLQGGVTAAPPFQAFCRLSLLSTIDLTSIPCIDLFQLSFLDF